MVSEGYCCIFSEEGCWQRGSFALGWSILAVLASRMGFDGMLVDCGSVQTTSRNHKATETLKHPLLQDPRGTRAR